MWTYRSADGLWTIAESAGLYALMFNGEVLTLKRRPEELLSAVRAQTTNLPRCGLNPAQVGLPMQLRDWQREEG